VPAVEDRREYARLLGAGGFRGLPACGEQRAGEAGADRQLDATPHKRAPAEANVGFACPCGARLDPPSPQDSLHSRWLQLLEVGSMQPSERFGAPACVLSGANYPVAGSRAGHLEPFKGERPLESGLSHLANEPSRNCGAPSQLTSDYRQPGAGSTRRCRDVILVRSRVL
jgi:hypothetical protein